MNTPQIQTQAGMVRVLRHSLPPPVEMVETHISWVLLSGDYAYKIKKAVNFGFLDFSTLAQRRFYCDEELRLNRRLAPQLYLDVVPVCGSVTAPILGGNGSDNSPHPCPLPHTTPHGLQPIVDRSPSGHTGKGDGVSLRDARPIEYAVKMRRFPAAAQFDAMLAHGTLKPTHIDALADKIASFHQTTAGAALDSPFGTAEAVHQPAQQNFAQIRPYLDQPADLAQLERLQAWSASEFQRLAATFAQRKEQGCIRECHGDLHLANLALFEGEVAPFDCIEFNANLRWIDTISEIAFLTMDLHDRRRPEFAWRLLNAYLAHSGDYAGLAVLRYYLVYRALVRAKVASLGSTQEILAGTALAQCREYLALAASFIRPARPFILITHGLSGSGKTTLAGGLAAPLGAIRIRSDIERKRLFGLAPTARSGSGVDAGLYTAEAHQLTYRKLAELAGTIVAAGYPVIVDAAFLQHAEREIFQQLADKLGSGFAVLDLQAPPEVLQQRIVQREKIGQDASEASVAVLHRQLAYDEPVTANEKCRIIRVDAQHYSLEEILAATRRLLAQ